MLPGFLLDFIKEALAVISEQDICSSVLTEGRSGADVYRIKVQSRRERLNGNYIVKVCDDVQDNRELEGDKARKLYQYAANFTEHLVKVEAEQKLDGKDIIIYRQANNSVRNTIALSDLDGDHMAKYMRRVSYDLLSSLNKDRTYGGTAESFFQSLLARQLGENGRFGERMSSLLKRPEAACIPMDGEIYPNPFYFIEHIPSWSRDLPDLLFQGVVHGDLHGYNLLAMEDTYAVIDYDSVSMDSYLFFDHAYLEFSVFYDNSKNNDLKSWKAMLDRLVDCPLLKEAKPCENYKEYMVRNAVCGGIADWVHENQLEGMGDDIELQFMMARIAAGINFFCKKSCADIGKQMKVLFYIAYCFRLLLEKIKYQYNKNDVSPLCNGATSADSEKMWEDFIKFQNYVPVLITDDRYSAESFEQICGLCGMNWQMIMDIGHEQEDMYVYKSILGNVHKRAVKRINMVAGEKAEIFYRTLNVVSVRKKADSTYHGLWREYKVPVMEIIKKLLSANPQIPLVLIFDCSHDSLPFKNQMINSLCDCKLPRSTRVVSLRAPFSEELRAEIPELVDRFGWYFIEHAEADLTHVAQVCRTYLNGAAGNSEHMVNLPSINGIYTFSEQDVVNYETCIELVYAGCECTRENELEYSGLDMSEGDSQGEKFYKGNEATWNDIANHRDLDVIGDEKYKTLCGKLSDLIEGKSPRVKSAVLLHGAGAGGTTLSKRILWDFKDQVPCMRLKKYAPKVVDILLEIYQKTGKCILLSIESGSTVIADDELHKLKKLVDASNGRMVILLIKRKDASTGEQGEAVLEQLGDTMPISPIAKRFQRVFSEFAKKRENAEDRIAWLDKITGQDEYKEQRSPFFYGFYAFQEEYELFGSLMRTVQNCNHEERNLLNSLALITFFSQNIYVSFSELRLYLKPQDAAECAENIYSLLEMLPSAVSKLTIVRDRGLRLCHKVIAEKVLLILHDSKGGSQNIEDVVFEATKEYIQFMSEIYDSNDEYVSSVLKELVIDRAYIDSEERKTKFSKLVESIPLWTDRRALFDFLIEKFPDNPHYYNHLARLLAVGDKENGIIPQYEEAEKMAEKAIEVATVAKATHETTLGCIYGQWILSDIEAERKNKQRGRLSASLEELISNIQVRYSLARAQFEQSRNDIDVCDSFSYFPQINMECEIIKKIIAFDSDRNVARLLAEESVFRKWYDEHFSIATELYLMMREQLGDDVRLLKEAKYRLSEIAEDSGKKINRIFESMLGTDTAADRIRRRSLTYTLFSINGCRWNNIEKRTLQLAEKSFRKNILGRDEEHINSDVETWFELFRRTEYFQAQEAQAFIADYMEEGFRKDYLLYLMTFIMYKDGVASASEETIYRQINNAKRVARLNGMNTAREHDVYVGGNGKGCPIVPVSDVAKDEDGNMTGLEIFTGTVTEVEQTHGKIILDHLNLDVTFIPRPQSAGDDPARIFTRDDLNCPVKLNIMFSYSGLRAWNPVKVG